MYRLLMPDALYFPYSRCLDELTLKQAVLIYDRLLFVDPVDPEARSALYLREAPYAHANPRISERWLAAQRHYELLQAHGLVHTVHPAALNDPQLTDTLVAENLQLDLDENRAGASLFRGRRRWQMLASRLPPSALEGRFAPRPAARGWTGEPVVEVPYAVGASVTLTYALVLAHEAGAVPMTDIEDSHRLLLMRLAAAAARDGNVPPLHAQPTDAYVRRQIELRLVDELAPAPLLARMDMEDVLDYRRDNAQARAELSGWIDLLSAKVQSRPWDPAMSAELEQIAGHAREIAAQPGRWRGTLDSARGRMSPARLAAATISLAAPSTVTAVVAPHVSLVGALAVGGTAALATASDALRAGVDRLLASRPAEHNAVAYLHRAHRR